MDDATKQHLSGLIQGNRDLAQRTVEANLERQQPDQQQLEAAWTMFTANVVTPISEMDAFLEAQGCESKLQIGEKPASPHHAVFSASLLAELPAKKGGTVPCTCTVSARAPFEQYELHMEYTEWNEDVDALQVVQKQVAVQENAREEISQSLSGLIAAALRYSQ